MCAFGMQIQEAGLMRNVKKRTKFMTNAPRIADGLSRMCSRDHDHIRLDGGNRTRKSEVYPDELCKQIIGGLKHQMKDDGRWMNSMTVCAIDKDQEDQDYETGEYWDDMSGKRLDPELVKQAREEEMMEFRKHGVYVKVPVKECWDVTGRPP